MALKLCTVCDRKQYFLLPNVCSGHTELRFSAEGKVVVPTDPTKFLIPTYKAEVKPPYQPPVKVKSNVKTGLLFKDSKKIDSLLGIKASAEVNTEFKCSFCGTKVDHTTLTRGITKPRKVLSTDIEVVNGEIVIVDKINHIPSKVMACPDCVLYITPVFNRCRFCKGKSDEDILKCFACKGSKQGEMVSQGTVFPEFD